MSIITTKWNFEVVEKPVEYSASRGGKCLVSFQEIKNVVEYKIILINKTKILCIIYA